jgi:hypothetical protein
VGENSSGQVGGGKQTSGRTRMRVMGLTGVVADLSGNLG